jgi:hypothetical protein
LALIEVCDSYERLSECIEEAYENLKRTAQRERYRRAIGGRAGT